MKIICEELCCGCGNCANICSLKAINMKLDEEGFLYPIVDDNKCVDCGRCREVCPIINIQSLQIESHNLKTFCGYFLDKNKLLSSSSGGAASAISEKIIELGGVVYGTSYDKSFTKAYIKRANTIEELESLRGSKYIQSIKYDVFIEIQELLKNGVLVLFIGTPCDIGALKSFIKEEYINLYTVELICMGPTSYRVSYDYIKKLEETYQSKIVDFTIRYKKHSWENQHIKAEFENGDCFMKRFDNTDYARGFALFGRPSCYNCTFKGDRKVADITVGDFWGVDNKHPHYNKNGMSVIFIHTNKGEELLSKLSGFALYEESTEFATKNNPRLETSRRSTSARQQFSNDLLTYGLEVACENSKTMSYKMMKGVEQILPVSIAHKLKRLLKNVKK